MPIPSNPTISSISPNTGPVGTHVYITGNNLSGAYVQFNGVTASILSQTNTSMIVVAPASSTGLVIAHNPYGSSGGFLYTYTSLPAPTISSLTPTSGPVGTPVTIAGTNFGTTQSTSTVTVNGVAATVSSWSSTSIIIAIPATATTGNVVVTVGGVSSNAVPFTVTTPSNGGYQSPVNMLFIPGIQFNSPVIYTLDPTNFDDPASGSYYNWKVEDVQAGRTPTCNKVIISYRDLGVATITVTLSGLIGETDSMNANTPISKSTTVNIGTAGATQKICTLTLGMALTAANLQCTVTRAAGSGPVSITKLRLEGAVEK